MGHTHPLRSVVRHGRIALVFRAWGAMAFFPAVAGPATVAASGDIAAAVIVALTLGLVGVFFGVRLMRLALILDMDEIVVRNVTDTITVTNDQLDGAVFVVPSTKRISVKPTKRASLTVKHRPHPIDVSAVSMPPTPFDSAGSLDTLARDLKQRGVTVERL